MIIPDDGGASTVFTGRPERGRIERYFRFVLQGVTTLYSVFGLD